MVRKLSEDGLPYHEPPYTEAEEAEMYARMNRPPVAFTRPGSVQASQADAPPGVTAAQPPQPTETSAPAARSANELGSD